MKAVFLLRRITPHCPPPLFLRSDDHHHCNYSVALRCMLSLLPFLGPEPSKFVPPPRELGNQGMPKPAWTGFWLLTSGQTLLDAPITRERPPSSGPTQLCGAQRAECIRSIFWCYRVKSGEDCPVGAGSPTGRAARSQEPSLRGFKDDGVLVCSPYSRFHRKTFRCDDLVVSFGYVLDVMFLLSIQSVENAAL